MGMLFCAAHWQLSKWPRGEEMLQRAVVMRELMGDRADNSGLPIRQARKPDASLFPQARATTIRRHNQLCTKGTAI
jgi:hypothetical protein